MKYTPSERCQKIARRIRIPSDLNDNTSVKVEVAVGTADIVIHPKTPQERIVKLATEKQMKYMYEELNLHLLIAKTETQEVASTQNRDHGGGGKGK